MIAPVSKAALAAGADGIIVEVHPYPDRALCDGDQSLEIDQFRALMEEAGFERIEVLRGDGTPSGKDDPAFIFRARSPAA